MYESTMMKRYAESQMDDAFDLNFEYDLYYTEATRLCDVEEKYNVTGTRKERVAKRKQMIRDEQEKNKAPSLTDRLKSKYSGVMSTIRNMSQRKSQEVLN